MPGLTSLVHFAGAHALLRHSTASKMVQQAAKEQAVPTAWLLPGTPIKVPAPLHLAGAAPLLVAVVVLEDALQAQNLDMAVG